MLVDRHDCVDRDSAETGGYVYQVTRPDRIVLNFLCHGERPLSSLLELKDWHTNEAPQKILMDITERITIDPAICHGKPCIRGLRYPVENVLEWLAGGMTIEDILSDYEDLEREDILAALAYAARLMHVKRIDRPAA